jgi:hypothetical protein
MKWKHVVSLIKGLPYPPGEGPDNWVEASAEPDLTIGVARLSARTLITGLADQILEFVPGDDRYPWSTYWHDRIEVAARQRGEPFVQEVFDALDNPEPLEVPPFLDESAGWHAWQGAVAHCLQECILASPEDGRMVLVELRNSKHREAVLQSLASREPWPDTIAGELEAELRTVLTLVGTGTPSEQLTPREERLLASALQYLTPSRPDALVLLAELDLKAAPEAKEFVGQVLVKTRAETPAEA